MVFGSVNTLLFIAWNFETASIPRKRKKHFGTFSVHVRLMVLELALLEKEEEEEEEEKKKKMKKKRKENDDFLFFKIRFLGFYKAEQKSEDIFVLRRVRAFSRYPFCWL